MGCSEFHTICFAQFQFGNRSSLKTEPIRRTVFGKQTFLENCNFEIQKFHMGNTVDAQKRLQREQEKEKSFFKNFLND